MNRSLIFCFHELNNDCQKLAVDNYFIARNWTNRPINKEAIALTLLDDLDTLYSEDGEVIFIKKRQS